MTWYETFRENQVKLYGSQEQNRAERNCDKMNSEKRISMRTERGDAVKYRASIANEMQERHGLDRGGKVFSVPQLPWKVVPEKDSS